MSLLHDLLLHVPGEEGHAHWQKQVVGNYPGNEDTEASTDILVGSVEQDDLHQLVGVFNWHCVGEPVEFWTQWDWRKCGRDVDHNKEQHPEPHQRWKDGKQDQSDVLVGTTDSRHGQIGDHPEDPEPAAPSGIH